MSYRQDSLKAACDELRNECGKLLAQLPDTAAMEAYDAYQLEWLGVGYQSASTPVNMDRDSVLYIQQEELYYTAAQLHETNTERLMYHVEGYKRMFNAISLLLVFLIFAALGYILRNEKIRNVMGIIAIIIIAGFYMQQVAALGKWYADDAKNQASMYEREMRNMKYR